MDGKCHFIVFLLFVHYAISQNCDCKLLDILRNIVQREMTEREMLVSRVEMLESKQGTGTNNGANSSGYSSDNSILERLSVLESMMENFNTKLNEITMERQSGTRLNSVLLSAWKIHKHGVSVMNADVQKSIKDNNIRFNQLTLEVDKHKDVIASNVAELINQTNNMVTKQMEDVEKRFEGIRSGLNNTLADYVTKMDKGLAVFLNQTDSTLNGIRAEIKTNECASNPCWNGATCVDGIQSYTCICLAGYSGSQCQINIEECSNNPCLNGATCVDGINSYSCKCQVGYVYVGGYCQVDECYNNPCMNGATCENSIGNYSCRCLPGYAGINCQKAQDCTAIRKTGVTKSGVYTVSLWKTKNEIQVFCDMSTDNGGWTVFQNRFDGSVDFYQNFASYENGFGHLSGEFWLGLKYVQEMTSMSQTELRLDLSAADGSTAYEVFQNFRLTEGPDYKLNIDHGTGTAGDEQGLSFSEGYPFTTFDHDADTLSMNCAVLDHGGWWYANCAHANLNGEYITPGTVSSESKGERGMTYYNFKGVQSLQTSKLMFRRIIA